MTDLSRLLSSAALLLIVLAEVSCVTKKHGGKHPTTHEQHKELQQDEKHKHGSKHRITGTRVHHHTATKPGETTTNYVQYKIRNRDRLRALKPDKDKSFWESNETISLDSYSFQPMEWSDNRCPPTLRPFPEHLKMWKTLMAECTYPPTSDPEITLDQDISQPCYFQCAYCFDKFDDDWKLKHHYETKHREQWIVTTTKDPIMYCGLCLNQFNQSEFRHHQQSVHNFTVERYDFENTDQPTYSSFDTKEAKDIFDKRFGGSDEYQYYTYPKNNTFYMTMYDIDSNNSDPITHHYIDPWPNANI